MTTNLNRNSIELVTDALASVSGCTMATGRQRLTVSGEDLDRAPERRQGRASTSKPLASPAAAGGAGELTAADAPALSTCRTLLDYRPAGCMPGGCGCDGTAIPALPLGLGLPVATFLHTQLPVNVGTFGDIIDLLDHALCGASPRTSIP